jgi:hypothetical protein
MENHWPTECRQLATHAKSLTNLGSISAVACSINIAQINIEQHLTEYQYSNVQIIDLVSVAIENVLAARQTEQE